jgi:hypothetical protein
MTDALLVEPYLMRQAQCIADAGTTTFVVLLSWAFVDRSLCVQLSIVEWFVAGKAFENECSYPAGYVHQPVYACVTCHGSASPFYGEVWLEFSLIANLHSCPSPFVRALRFTTYSLFIVYRTSFQAGGILLRVHASLPCRSRGIALHLVTYRSSAVATNECILVAACFKYVSRSTCILLAQVIELFNKRGFRCDCPTTKFPTACALVPSTLPFVHGDSVPPVAATALSANLSHPTSLARLLVPNKSVTSSPVARSPPGSDFNDENGPRAIPLFLFCLLLPAASISGVRMYGLYLFVS